MSMSEPTQASRPPGPIGQAEFLLWREVDRLDGRITDNARAIDRLDQMGSRGVESLRSKVDQLAHDLEQHEQQHVSSRRWTIGVVLAVVVPLYPMVGALVLKLT
jgi:hypothetical protein